MHYVSAEQLSKSYGIKPLFENISFHISEGDKIALVARNGSGKSTLLRILAGLDQPDSGNLWIHKDIQVTLFEQEPVFHETQTILENIFHHPHPAGIALKAYEYALSKPEGDALLQEAITAMDENDAWDYEARVRQILGRLNLHQLDQPVNSLSGGQRKRVALARTLIDIGFAHRHTLLILDEPTNHLDVEMVEWLEHYLNQEKVTLFMVTHDRYFLDAVCSEIWEIDEGVLHSYQGDYALYLEQKSARIDNLQSGIHKARNEYRKELEWMRRQPRARGTKARSRIDNFYEIEKKAKQKVTDNNLSLQMKMSRLGGKIAELKKVYKSFGDKQILRGFDYTFKKGERIGIIGKNGAGKSTFLQILQGHETADSGKINIGETIVFGNFSQQGLTISEDMRVIEYVRGIAENFPLADGGSLSASQFLELFLFTPDQQYTMLSRLSGGEKKRLQMLTVLFRNPNFLILDEPTNDLDLPTLTVLEQFLSEYQGCLLIVSHDRYFMDRLVDHLFVFEGDGVITDFPGNYTQYRIRQEEMRRQQTRTAEALPEKTAPGREEETKKAKQKLSYKESRELEQLEKKIPLLEEEKETVTRQMQEAGLAFEELSRLADRISAITEELEISELRWLELSELQA